MLPSLILVLIIAKLLKKFSDNFYVKSIISILKPLGCALLSYVALQLLISDVKDLKSALLLLFLLILSWKSKKDPLFYIIISILIGIILRIIF